MVVFVVSEGGCSLSSIRDAWNRVFGSYESVVCLLLANPLEVVALACEDPVWQPKLLSLLGPVNVRGEPVTPDNLLESVKLLKTPSWRYRTEVQGLLETACLRVTKGKYQCLEAVRVQCCLLRLLLCTRFFVVSLSWSCACFDFVLTFFVCVGGLCLCTDHFGSADHGASQSRVAWSD
jgi:hypothetical protein